jgi:hypothetical protein
MAAMLTAQAGPSPFIAAQGAHRTTLVVGAKETWKTLRRRNSLCGDCGSLHQKWSSYECPTPGFNARGEKAERKGENKAENESRPAAITQPHS